MDFTRLEYWSRLAVLFSRGSSQPGDQTQVSCIADRFFTIWTTREALYNASWYLFQDMVYTVGCDLPCRTGFGVRKTLVLFLNPRSGTTNPEKNLLSFPWASVFWSTKWEEPQPPHEVAVRMSWLIDSKALALAVCIEWWLFFHVCSVLHANVDIHLFMNE